MKQSPIDGSKDAYKVFLRNHFAQVLGWQPVFDALWQFESLRPVHMEVTRYTRDRFMDGAWFD